MHTRGDNVGSSGQAGCGTGAGGRALPELLPSGTDCAGIAHVTVTVQVGVVLSVARSWEGLIEWPAAAVPSRVAVG